MGAFREGARGAHAASNFSHGGPSRGGVGGGAVSYYGANPGVMPGGRGAGMYGPSASSRGATQGMNLKQARGAIMRMKSQAQQSNYAHYQQQQQQEYHQQQQQQQYDAYSRGAYGDYHDGTGYSSYSQYPCDPYYGGENVNHYPHYGGGGGGGAGGGYYPESGYPYGGMEQSNWGYSSMGGAVGGAYSHQMGGPNFGASRGRGSGSGVGRGGGVTAVRGGVKGRGRGSLTALGKPGKGKKSGAVGKKANAAASAEKGAGRGTVLKSKKEEEKVGPTPEVKAGPGEGGMDAKEDSKEVNEPQGAEGPTPGVLPTAGNHRGKEQEDEDKLTESWAEQIEDFVNKLATE